MKFLKYFKVKYFIVHLYIGDTDSNKQQSWCKVARLHGATHTHGKSPSVI